MDLPTATSARTVRVETHVKLDQRATRRNVFHYASNYSKSMVQRCERRSDRRLLLLKTIFFVRIIRFCLCHATLAVLKQKQWATDLEALCSETADERTCIEATAYSAWMSGNLLLEKGLWREALGRYSTAHRICEELGKVRPS